MIHIAFGIDDKFVMPCGVTITSICENNRDEDIFFHVLNSSLTEENKESLSSIANSYEKHVDFCQVDVEKLKGCYVNVGAANGCIATYFRFLLPILLPDVSKVLYLDCDIVVRQSIRDLWDTDVSKKALAACLGENNDCIRAHNLIDLPMSYGYFNAGVLLVNLEYWREKNVFDRLIRYSIDHPGNNQQDQDCLNIVLRDERGGLNVKYNLQENLLVPHKDLLIDRCYFAELDEAVQNPTIIHYTNSPKPWHKDCRHPFRKEWRKYYAMTKWANIPLKYCYPKKIFLRLLRNILSRFGLCNPIKNKYRLDLTDGVWEEQRNLWKKTK